MPSNRIKFMSALVPIFGLISCTANKPSASVDDPSHMKPPVIQSRHGDTENMKALSVASTDRISADADVIFNGGVNDGSVASVEATAVCRSSLGEQSSKTTIQNVDRAPLLSLIPEAIWLNFDPAILQSATLQLSIRSYKYHRLYISIWRAEYSICRCRNSCAIKSDHRSFTLNRTIWTATRYDFISQCARHLHVKNGDGDDSDLSRSFSLLCDHMQNHRSRAPQESADQIVDELVNGAITVGDAKISGPDPRSAFTKQNCRLAEHSLNEKTGVSNIAMSPVFHLNYPLGSADIGGQVSFPPSDGFIKVYGRSPFATMTIHNRTNASLAFKYPANRAHTLWLRGVSANGTWRVGDLVTMNFSVQITGDNRRWAQGDDVIFEVAPSTTVTISANQSQHFSCEGMMPLGPRFGFTYRVDSTMILAQMDNWDTQNISLSGDSENVNPISLATGQISDYVFEGWVPAVQGVTKPAELNSTNYDGVPPWMDSRCFLGDTPPF